MGAIVESSAAAIQATTAGVYERYLANLDATDKTRRTYAAALRSWASYLESARVGELQATREDVLSYRDMLKATRSSSTVNAYMTALRSFYSWLEAIRACPNVAAGVHGVRVGRTNAKDALTREQARALVEEPANTLKELRDRAIVTLMISRGLRTIEIVRADVADVRQVAGEAVLFVQGKGYADKGAFVKLNEPVLCAIRDYLDARGPVDPADPLFCATGNRNGGGRMTTRSVSRIAKEALERHGLSSARLTAHSMRHTAVTLALKGGATIQETAQMARHASISTTEIYAHNLERMANAAEDKVDAYLFG